MRPYSCIAADCKLMRPCVTSVWRLLLGSSALPSAVRSAGLNEPNRPRTPSSETRSGEAKP
eukprot:4363691-Prorocentrum_lima.AAC.1